MMPMTVRLDPGAKRRVAVACLLAVTLAGTWTSVTPAAASTVPQQREERRTFSGGPGTTLDIENLVGSVVVEGGSGGDIEVVATVHAEDGRQADADTLLGLAEVEFEESGGRIEVRVDYPVERFDVYRYPEGGSNTTTRYQSERVRVTSRNDDDAVTLYVDFVVRVPAGVDVDVENVVGDVSSNGMQGDFSGETGSGDVRISEIDGAAEADTGSGDVDITGVTGEVNVDTGSGDVEVRDVTGDLSADTGSGTIRLFDIDGDVVDADTGSGDIHMERVGGIINADTGSGDITGRDINAGASIGVDSGSGDIRFSGDFSRVRQIEIDVSSGDVDLEMRAHPGFRIVIETGSGGIDVDLPDLQVERSRRNYFRGTSGDGDADISIETGSGSVRIRGS